MKHSIITETDHCIDVCNRLLRGELSALETYNKAIRKFGGLPQIVRLGEIRDEHAASAERLRENVNAMGGEPGFESGGWGTFATSVQSTADFFGDNAALWALKQGEEYGRGLYEAALEDEHVMPECKTMIRNELYPRLKRHLVVLEAMSETV